MSTRKKDDMTNKFQGLVRDIKGSEVYDKEVARGDISDQIHALMERQNVKPSELARRLGKSRAYITKLLQGNANFTIDSLVQIARALGCRYTPLFISRGAWEEVERMCFSAT